MKIIILHKTLHNIQRKRPYPSLPGIRPKSVDGIFLEGKHSTISHTDKSAPGGSRFSARDDLNISHFEAVGKGFLKNSGDRLFRL